MMRHTNSTFQRDEENIDYTATTVETTDHKSTDSKKHSKKKKLRPLKKKKPVEEEQKADEFGWHM